jgi:hypothetical protein
MTRALESARLLSLIAMLAACGGGDPPPSDTEPDAGSGGGGGDRPRSPDAAPQPDPGPDAAPAPAVRCDPKIDFSNTSAGGNGKIFTRHIPDAVAFAKKAAQSVCSILYKSQSEVPSVATIKLVIEDMDGVAYTAGDEVHFSSTYMADFASGRNAAAITYELTGVVVHEFTHVYQYNDGEGWAIEGVADFVRLRAGYIPASNRRRGGNYDDAYQTTAFFLDWIDTGHAGFGHQFNQSMTSKDNKGWSTAVFKTLTGSDVDTLWKQYQASLP